MTSYWKITIHLNLPYIIYTYDICQKCYRGTPPHHDEKPVSLYSLVHPPAYEAIIVHEMPSIPSLPIQRYPPVFFPSVHLVHFSWLTHFPVVLVSHGNLTRPFWPPGSPIKEQYRNMWVSLRGRRSKRKGKGIRARDDARGRREEGSAPRALARPNSSFPFPF